MFSDENTKLIWTKSGVEGPWVEMSKIYVRWSRPLIPNGRRYYK